MAGPRAGHSIQGAAMAEIINLRQARKAAARKADRAAGDANAARFGRSKAEKALEQARAEQSDRHLDGHLRGDDAPQE